MDTPIPLSESDYALIRRVARILRKRLPPMVDIADLINDGYFGLRRAIERFDSSRGVTFERYAAGRIRGAMLDGLRARAWVPRQAKGVRIVFPSVFVRTVEPKPRIDDELESVSEPEQRAWARQVVTTLPLNARRVMHLYYFEEHSMKEVGMILGVSESRVSQIHGRAIVKLKKRSHFDAQPKAASALGAPGSAREETPRARRAPAGFCNWHNKKSA